MLQQVRSFLLL